jgi:hypothetical protein
MLSDGPAVADLTARKGAAAGQDSIRKRLLSEPDSPSAAELISTAVPSDMAAAADAAGAADGHFGPRTGLTDSLDYKEFAGASFEELCNDGSRWTAANWGVKLYRWTLLITKQIYLIWLAVMSVPTNHLMVRRQCRSVSYAMLGQAVLVFHRRDSPFGPGTCVHAGSPPGACSASTETAETVAWILLWVHACMDS